MIGLIFPFTIKADNSSNCFPFGFSHKNPDFIPSTFVVVHEQWKLEHHQV